MPAIEGDEEVKEGKGLNMFTPSKLWTRHLVLLSQIKAGNNSSKLKNEIRKILIFCISIMKSSKKVYNNLIKSLW